jgi:dipeptidyl aminopeptidase/acylaminoacyl peptidase
MIKKAALLALSVLIIPSVALAQKRPLAVDDVYNVKDVRDPQRSPDGKWVAYVVSRAIKDGDKNDTDIWMASWDGSQDLQVTSSPDGESQPRWSPDNKYLSFVSSRQGAKGGQLWLMNRAGGEAIKVSEVKPGISSYAWSPDAKRIVFVVSEPDPRDPKDDDKEAADKKKTPPPIVVDRYHFKQDVSGYLRGERDHLYLFDVATKKAEALTTGALYEESDPAWSPDGTQIAFVSKRGTGDIDRNDNTDVWIVDAKAGAQPRQVTTSAVSDEGPLSWSPDGKQIAYLTGDELKYSAYAQNKLAIVSTAGGQPRLLAESLDRPVRQPQWSKDGSSIAFIVADDRSQYPARMALSGPGSAKPGGDGGRIERLITAKSVVGNLSAGPGDGAFAVLAASDTELPEVAALEGGRLRRLSHQNDEWLSKVLLGTTEEFTSISKDGTEVHGLIVKPATYQAGQKYPTLLRIHGGPNGQDDHAFSFERELFAANGYVVVAVNYRGSNGRGSAYQKAIFADWGGKEVIDLLGAMDHVQKIGLADPDRLGIGGWSYGGILTDYTIATDGRFKAAASGAGSALQLSMYGVDEYITQYENEIGPPWKNPDLWIKISYPFFHADRIKTPTLFLGGDRDFNVPLVGGEQMYQALRSLGVDTQLVIYPNQFHGITTPTYKIDRLQRYLDWYAKYLKPGTKTTTASR